MKRFASVVLVLMPALMLRSSAVSAQVLFGDEPDATSEPERQSSEGFSFALPPPDDGAPFGLPPAGEDAGKAGEERPESFGFAPMYFDIAPASQATDGGASTDAAVTTDDGGHFGLPLLGEQARKAGYELPKPFGFGLIYTGIRRDVQVSDVRIGARGTTPASISDVVGLRVRTQVDVALGRLDAWVFPFLNVYGLLGYVKNETHIRGTATLPRFGPVPIEATTNIEGPTVGFGTTLAGGYKEAFATLDVNWSETNLGFDDNFRATVATLRTGWNGKVHAVPTRLWTGVTYWDTFATASGSGYAGGVGPIRFEADQGPTNPWNIVFGGHVSVHENFDLTLEYGTNFNDVQIVTAMLTFRF